MSTFSFPEMMKPDAMTKAMPDISEWTKSLPAVPMSPLMVHPMAASSAAFAVGLGMAGQMMGLMAGSMQGAYEMSRRFGLPMPGERFDQASGAFAWQTDAAKPAVRAKVKVAAAPAARPAEAAEPKAPAPTRSPKTTGAVSKLKSAADTAADAVVEAETKAPTVPQQVAKAESAPRPEDFTQPAALDRPDTPDDLKRISGIGPKLEQVLNGLGIWSFGQIAGWNAREVAWVDDYLQFKGRIARDTWQEQAATLAAAGK